MNKERMDRIRECKNLVIKLPLETAIQLETTENELSLVKKENDRLRIYEKQIQKLHAAAARVEDGETDSFDFGQEVLEILGRF